MGAAVLLSSGQLKEGLSIECNYADIIGLGLPVSFVVLYDKSCDYSLLISGLQAALSAYPFFAGRLSRKAEKLYIDCSDQGIRVSRAKHEQRIGAIPNSLPVLAARSLIDPIKSSNNHGPGGALLSIRIGYFSCGGMSIGVSWDHAIADMHTFMLFMQSWADAVNAREATEPLILANRKQALAPLLIHTATNVASPLVRHVSRLGLVSFYLRMAISLSRTRQAFFYFSHDELQAMRNSLSEAAGKKLSINDSLCAHFAHSINSLDSVRPMERVVVMVNYRHLLGLPHCLCGNFATSIIAASGHSCEPHETALQIQSSRLDRSSILETLAATASLMRVKSSRGSFKQFIPSFVNHRGDSLVTSNWSKFGFLDIKFGDSRPFFFFPPDYISKIPGFCLITQCFPGDGLLFRVVLPFQTYRKIQKSQFHDRIHQYRSPAVGLPDDVSACKWIW